MRLRKKAVRRPARPGQNRVGIKPSLEVFEPRLLLATGFVQGFALSASNTPIASATVELINPGNSQVVASTTTNALGYYAFNGVTPGIYDVSESAAGYTASVTGSDIKTTIDPAAAINGGTEIQVTVVDPSTQSIGLDWGADYAFDNINDTLAQSAYNQAAPADQEGQGTVGILAVALSGNQGNENLIGSLCTDLLQGLYQNTKFTVTPALDPSSTTLPSLASYSVNLGEIGYLYNTYGTIAPTTQSLTSVSSAGLQLAIWSLEYNQMPASGPMTLTNPGSPFQVNAPTSSAIISAANNFLAGAYGQSEDAYFLNLNTTKENVYDAENGQSLISTDLLNFTNTTIVQATPSITTQASPTGETVGMAALTDTALLTGGQSPTGLITFTLTSPTNVVVDTENVAVNGNGDYSTPVGYVPTQVGTYYWVATYSGDTYNVGVASGATDEPVVVSQASPAITTQATVSAGGVVGTALLTDAATLSGGDSPTGTIAFSLTAPDGSTTSEGTANVSGDGVYNSPSVLATEVGIYTWHATYSGDTLNAGASDNGTNEGVTTVQASPTITTQATVSAGGVVGSALLTDAATLSGGDSPTGTIAFSLTAPDGSITSEGTANVSGDGVYNSPSVLATEVGIYTWHATYSGDTLNAGASDNGANEGVTTVQASPAITTQATVSAGGVVGTALLTDAATLSGGDSPTGTIAFSLTAPDGSITSEGTANVSGDGVYNSPSVLATEVGIYTWHATYSGDTLNAGASDNGANEGVTTVTASPAITTQATVSAGGVVGTALLTDAATLSGGDSPTGTIAFSLTAPDGSTSSEGTANVSGDGVYHSPSVLATEVGIYTWHATYSGDTLNAGASDNGANEGVTTVKASPAITTQATVSAGGVVGTALLTDAATLSGGDSPTGTIAFSLTAPDGSTTSEGTANVSGDGVYHSPSVLATEVGIYTWHATYGGDTLNVGASDNGANEGVTTIKASPAITTQATVSAGGVVGSALLTDAATLSGGDSPTGTIAFSLTAPDGSITSEGTANVSGDGVYHSPSVLATEVGIYTWHATYGGNTLNAGASDNGANEGVTTVKACSTITTTPNTTIVSQGTATNLQDTATLSGTYGGTGTITFTLYHGSTKLDTESVTVSGNGTYTTPKGYNLPCTAASGVYQWDASYSGDGKNLAATDNNDPDEQVTVVNSCCNLQDVWYWIQTPGGSGGWAANLGGVHQGDTVTVNFTVPSGDYDQLTLVSYVAPQSYYSATSAYLQTVYQASTGIFGPGAGALTVTVPNSYYQIDFVCGTAISQLGLSQSDFYNAQNRLQDANNGGTTIPSSMTGSTVGAGQTATPAFWIGTQGQALIDSLNGGPSATNLGNWLATVVPNLMGGAAGQTNAQLAAGIKKVGSSGAFADMVATALSAYVTDISLAGSVAKSYGFTVTTYGTGIDNYSVGSSGSALGLSNYTTYSVVTLLAALNAESNNGAVNGSATNAAIAVFGAIDTAGKIS